MQCAQDTIIQQRKVRKFLRGIKVNISTWLLGRFAFPLLLIILALYSESRHFLIVRKFLRFFLFKLVCFQK